MILGGFTTSGDCCGDTLMRFTWGGRSLFELSSSSPLPAFRGCGTHWYGDRTGCGVRPFDGARCPGVATASARTRSPPTGRVGVGGGVVAVAVAAVGMLPATLARTTRPVSLAAAAAPSSRLDRFWPRRRRRIAPPPLRPLSAGEVSDDAESSRMSIAHAALLPQAWTTLILPVRLVFFNFPSSSTNKMSTRKKRLVFLLTSTTSLGCILMEGYLAWLACERACPVPVCSTKMTTI